MKTPLPDPFVAPLGEGDFVSRERAVALLRRYPKVSQSETGELIRFYLKAAAIDTALISCDELAATNARLFERDHAKAISRGVQAPLVVVVVIACCALIALGFVMQVG